MVANEPSCKEFVSSRRFVMQSLLILKNLAKAFEMSALKWYATSVNLFSTNFWKMFDEMRLYCSLNTAIAPASS